MAARDTAGKWYMSDNTIFADAFNFLLYDGEPVIRPENLHEADTTEIALPYGNNARLPLQKQRDLKRRWPRSGTLKRSMSFRPTSCKARSTTPCR